MAEPPMTTESAPLSPCIGICLIDPATCRCRGCLRDIDEIATWYDASAAEKRAILARLTERRRHGPDRGSEHPE